MPLDYQYNLDNLLCLFLLIIVDFFSIHVVGFVSIRSFTDLLLKYAKVKTLAILISQK
jgi:hypothetical protein